VAQLPSVETGSSAEILVDLLDQSARRKKMTTDIKSGQFQESIMRNSVGRRQFNKLLASAGIATASVPLVGRPALAASGEDLQVFTFDVYMAPELHPGFAEAYGALPRFSIFGDLQEAFLKLAAGFKPDVTMTGFESIQRWRDAGLIAPIDTGKLTEWDNVFDKLKRSGALDDGIQWAVPFIWGSTSIVYRTDLAPEYADNHTWEILWDPKYKGKLAMRDSADEASIPAAMVSGIANPFNMNDEQIEQVKSRLVEQRDLLRFYYGDNTTLAQSIASGEVVAAYAWSDVYTELKAQGHPVGFMTPKEGIITWIDLAAIVKGSPAPDDLKYAYLNAILAPESGAYAIEEFGYGHSNQRAFDVADVSVLEELGWTNPDVVIDAGILLEPFEPDTQQKLNFMFDQVKAGL
jgi:spermidine/putrescine transport system substrate-binding protein